MAAPTAEFSCILCHATQHALRYDYGEVGIYRCACGLMALHPQPTLDRLQEVYNEDYFKNTRFFDTNIEKNDKLYGYFDYFAERANKQYQLNAMAADLYEKSRAMAPGRKPRLLEIGCGMGYFLDTAYDIGFEVTGVEFNPTAVQAITKKYRFPIYEGAFPEVPLPDAPYEVLCAFDVIEHLPDPVKAVQAMRRYVVDGGYLVLVTMNSGSFMSRLIGKRLEDFRRTSEHLYFFDRQSITRLMEDAGFAVEAIQSTGHTFQLDHLLDRCHLVFPLGFKVMKKLIWPKWLLKANFYVDLGTKISIIARKKAT